MGELFMKYPIESIVEYEGRKCRVLGYETYSNKCYLVCVDGDVECRIDVERMNRT